MWRVSPVINRSPPTCLASGVTVSKPCSDSVCRYRRGKLTTSDVDVIFTPGAGDERQDKGMIKALCSRLFRLGIVTHVLRECPPRHHTNQFINCSESLN